MKLFGRTDENGLRKSASEGAAATATAFASGGQALRSILTKEQQNPSEEHLAFGLISSAIAELPQGNSYQPSQSKEGDNKIEASAIELRRLLSADVNRRCWICYTYEDDEDAPDDELVNPCGCKGSTKWVHQICINQWIDQVQDGNASKDIQCRYCRTFFAYEFPTPSLFYRSLNCIDACYTAFCNTIIEGRMWSMLVFAAMASGATSIFKQQIKELFSLLKENSSSMVQQLVLGICLQLVVPTSLIMLEQHLSSLEDRISRALSSNDSSTNIRAIPPGPPPGEPNAEGVDGFHQIIAALLFPLVADSVGNVLYSSLISNSFRRYLAGSFTFVICRGILKTVYKRKQLDLQRKRRVKNRE